MLKVLPHLLPGHSIDNVIISFDEENGELLILLIHLRDKWMLPGGLIFKNEDIDSAAYRLLKERTSIDVPLLSEFGTFGRFQRRKPEEVDLILKQINNTSPAISNFMHQRFISTGYLAMVSKDECHLSNDVFGDEVLWVPIKDVPKLIFDHNEILEKAIEFLKLQLRYLPIGKILLPEKFTMATLRMLYEAILDKELDRGNFQKKILKLEILHKHEKLMTGASNRAPYLYSFNEENYNNLLDEGIGFSI